jgi:hypothetical protein
VIGQFLLVFALFSALCSSAQELPKITNAEEEIRALETVRLKSPNKTDGWSGNVAKDALFQLASGGVLNKQDLLTTIQGEVFEDSLDMSATRFSQIGDAAVFSYVFRRIRHEDASVVLHQHLRRTVVYQRTGSGWQLIASAISVIPYADLESKPVDPKVLETYLGVWPDTPAPSTVTLTRDGGKLMAQGANGSEKTELLALSDNMFVTRGDSTLITFEKGPDGKVTHTLLRDLGGSVQVHDRSISDRKHW